jgi:hypothetical protein
MRRALPLLVLLATPGLAQEGGLEAQLEACVAGMDMEAIGERAEAFAEARDYDARIAALCAAGDHAGADAYATETAAAFYAGDAEAGRARDCMADLLGEDFDRTTACD